MANLPYTRFKEYADVLKAKGLVNIIDLGDHSKIELTESGRNYLRDYEQMKRFLKSFGLD